MFESKTEQKKLYDFHENSDQGITLRIFHSMDAAHAPALIREFKSLFKDRKLPYLHVDLREVTALDDFGALVLLELKKIAINKKGIFKVENVAENVQEMVGILNLDSEVDWEPLKKKPHPGVFIRLGEGVINIVNDIRFLVSFIGSVSLSLLYVLTHPKSLRVDDTVLVMQKTGVDALPIVALISFLLGLIMAFMSAVQLQQFGANIYVASLVSLAMTRELGPIMTAIIAAGRSGSAFAAEIGTMKINEEVDALFTMGFDPTRFLVVPKIIACVIMIPFLTLFSDAFAIIGGLVVGVSMLDLTVNSYMAQTLKTLTMFDVFWGFLKSIVFAFLIAWIGCLRGFQVKGGAASVGRATTSAVVSSIFMIIVVDSIFSIILRYWG